MTDIEIYKKILFSIFDNERYNGTADCVIVLEALKNTNTKLSELISLINILRERMGNYCVNDIVCSTSNYLPYSFTLLFDFVLVKDKLINNPNLKADVCSLLDKIFDNYGDEIISLGKKILDEKDKKN